MEYHMHNLQTFCEKKKKTIYALIILLCVITIILKIIFSYFKDIWLDSAIILKEMESIYDGYVPYHTMHLNYPPLYFYWMAGLKWLFCIPYGCYHFYLTIQHLLLLGIGAFIYNISIIRKTKCSEKIKRSVPPRKTKCSFFVFPPHNKKTPQTSLGRFLFSILFQTFRSNLTFSSPSSSWRVRSMLFSYMCTLPRFSVIDFKGKSICRAIRYKWYMSAGSPRLASLLRW